MTVDDDPEEEEEVDLGMAAAAATAESPATSRASVPTGLSGMLDSWREFPAEAAGVFDASSGRTAVPETRK